MLVVSSKLYRLNDMGARQMAAPGPLKLEELDMRLTTSSHKTICVMKLSDEC
jgi:hypothetical protein